VPTAHDVLVDRQIRSSAKSFPPNAVFVSIKLRFATVLLPEFHVAKNGTQTPGATPAVKVVPSGAPSALKFNVAGDTGKRFSM
jgi:hypothetical protein